MNFRESLNQLELDQAPVCNASWHKNVGYSESDSSMAAFHRIAARQSDLSTGIRMTD
jgi:hypothetical protein